LEGWDTKNLGRIWKLDVAKEASSQKRQLTKKLLAADFNSIKENELGSFLRNPDMRIRLKAQFELSSRGAKGVEQFKKSINQKEHQLARVHGIWGISQMARKEKKYAQLLLPLLKDKDPEIRAQAAKWIGDIRYKEAGNNLLPLLTDDYSRTRFFAAEALGRIAYEPALQPIIDLLEANNDEDAYIRHAGSLALARIGNAGPLVELSNHNSPAVRMGAVLALRRLSHPGIANFLEDEDEYIVTEVARAINDDYSIEKALPALGNVLQNTNFTNEPLVRRAINANLRVGSRQAMQNLINYIQRTNVPVDMQAEAVATLSTWAKPSVLDRVDGRYRGVIERDPSLVKEAAAAPLIKLLGHVDNSLRINAIMAIAKLDIKECSSHLFDILQKDKEPQVRVEALNALAKMEDEQIDKAIQQAISDREKSVRIKGLELLATQDVSKELTAKLLAEVIRKRSPEEKQAAVLTLGSLPVTYSQEIFEDLLNQMEQEKLVPEIYLELAEAIDSTHSQTLKSRYDQIRTKMGSDSELSIYQGSLYGGNEQVGKTIFFQHQTAQCMKCHSFDDFGGNAGPRINGVAGTLSRQQILEALINPSKDLAPGFGIVSLDVKFHKVVNGS